ncbi:MAG: MFS transporter, partial [Eubacteriales bacterium]|nr:MFS transporter [Eubacteriales bacterium]
MNNIKIGKYEISTDLFIFLIISVLLGIVAAVENTSLANRLYEELDFTVMQRSMLETPRELPGLLTVVMIGILNGLGDIRIAAVANIIGGIGLLLFGLAPNQYSLILLFLVIYSTGQHLYLPMNSSITMSFAKGENFGQRMGQIQGLGSLSIIIASGG